MKTLATSFQRLGIVVLPLLFVPCTWAIPSLRLNGSTLVSVGQQWIVSLYVDGVTHIDPILGPEELLAFGFDVGYPYTSLSFSGFSVNTGLFNDDTPLLGGAFAGSAFPGVTGDNILLGSLMFSGMREGIARINVGVQVDRPDIYGLFTTLDHYSFSAYADVTVMGIPDNSFTLVLLLLGISSLVFLLKNPRPGYLPDKNEGREHRLCLP